MKEIKFRGFDIDSKVWRYGYYFLKEDATLAALYNSKEQWMQDKNENEHHLIIWNGFSDWGLPKPHYQSEVDGDSIGQYTGLKDKNGKEIYEGDILKYEWDGKTIIDFIEYSGNMFTYHNSVRWNLQVDEVIGNVYENPELLN